MARVKHIMCDVLPANLEPYAIYFDRGGQKIVQTDGDGVPVEFGKKQLLITFNAGIRIDKDGKFSTCRPVGYTFPYWDRVINDTLPNIIKRSDIATIPIPNGYFLKEVWFKARKILHDLDAMMTIYKNKTIHNTHYSQDYQSPEIIKQINLTGEGGKKLNVEEKDIPIKVFNNDQFGIVFNSNIMLSSGNYIYESGLYLLFEEI